MGIKSPVVFLLTIYQMAYAFIVLSILPGMGVAASTITTVTIAMAVVSVLLMIVAYSKEKQKGAYGKMGTITMCAALTFVIAASVLM